MEGDSCDREILEEVDIARDEDGVYKRYLGECTHVIYAIGYTRNVLPRVIVDGRNVEEELEFDMHSSGFHLKERERLRGKGLRSNEAGERGREKVKGLFGCGIAFPEEVEDPEGHVEKAVGLGKFFKFAERVKGDWVKVK